MSKDLYGYVSLLELYKVNKVWNGERKNQSITYGTGGGGESESVENVAAGYLARPPS